MGSFFSRAQPVARSATNKVARKEVSPIKYWDALSFLPLGLRPFVFSFLVTYTAPYSGTIMPRIQELRPGYCRGEITETFHLKNPFNSIHALAISNLGELVSGLVVMETLRAQRLRGIVSGLNSQYFKKAKGTISAVAEIDPNVELLSAGQTEGTFEIATNVYDVNDQHLACITAFWNIKRL